MDMEVGTEIESVATLAQVGRHTLGFSVRSLVPPFSQLPSAATLCFGHDLMVFESRSWFRLLRR